MSLHSIKKNVLKILKKHWLSLLFLLICIVFSSSFPFFMFISVSLRVVDTYTNGKYPLIKQLLKITRKLNVLDNLECHDNAFING